MTDAPSRVERLLNLLALLLDTDVPRTQVEIVREVSGYPDAKDAARRAFERDKETLRGMGVPVRVEQVPFGEVNEVGYRVDPAEYYLPDLELDPDETAALTVAVQAVSIGDAMPAGGRDTPSRAALMKLGGLTGEGLTPIASLPFAPALPALFEAYRRRATAGFTYRGEAREVEVWALVARRGRWYVVGFDRGRDAVRTFRADRIDGDVAVGAPDAFAIPPGFDADAHLRDEPWTWGDGEPVVVELRVDRGHEEGVHAAASDATVLRTEQDATVFAIPVVDVDAFRGFVLGFLEHAEVLGPEHVRADIVAWLDACIG